MNRNEETKLQAAGQIVADHIFAAEHAFDRAYLAMAEACAALPIARMETNTAAESAQQSYIGAAETLRELATARGRLMRCHREVAVWATRVGLEPSSFGGGAGKPLVEPAQEPVAA